MPEQNVFQRVGAFLNKPRYEPLIRPGETGGGFFGGVNRGVREFGRELFPNTIAEAGGGLINAPRAAIAGLVAAFRGRGPGPGVPLQPGQVPRLDAGGPRPLITNLWEAGQGFGNPILDANPSSDGFIGPPEAVGPDYRQPTRPNMGSSGRGVGARGGEAMGRTPEEQAAIARNFVEQGRHSGAFNNNLATSQALIDSMRRGNMER